MGTNVSRLFLSSEAGIGSSGEQFIPYANMIDRISSSVAGSNTSNIRLLSRESALASTTVGGKVFRIFTIFSPKYVWNLSASSSVEL